MSPVEGRNDPPSENVSVSVLNVDIGDIIWPCQINEPRKFPLKQRRLSYGFVKRRGHEDGLYERPMV